MKYRIRNITTGNQIHCGHYKEYVTPGTSIFETSNINFAFRFRSEKATSYPDNIYEVETL